MSQTNPDATVDDLQRQIDLLRAEVESMRRRSTAAVHTAPTDEVGTPRSSTRRGMLKLAGATAAGAMASAALAGRAAADTGYTTGGAISVGDVVRQQLNGSRPAEVGFLFATTSSPALTSNTTLLGSALAGWAIDEATPVGVYGQSQTAAGYGVIGIGGGTAAVGVRGSSASLGVWGTATDPTSTGVRGAGGRYGVDGAASASDGVGVRGTATGADGVGVRGVGGRIGIEGTTDTIGGVGGSFGGPAGAIRVRTDIWGSPPSRGLSFQPGVIEADAHGDLWFCFKGGNPGDWRKITGASTAGAFHAIAPGRVYDSRAAAPTPGTISGGQHRTISVADQRDPASGAVTVTDLVPVGATAIAANITVVSTDGAGFLVCNPGGETAVNASTINWSAAGQVLANGVILSLDAERRLTIVAGGGGTTHVIVDVTGYWR